MSQLCRLVLVLLVIFPLTGMNEAHAKRHDRFEIPLIVSAAEPTPEPTPEPTTSPLPSPEPTISPTANPSPSPTPSSNPTPEPTAQPTPEPTAEPTPMPTTQPTAEPTITPSPLPTALPSPMPTSTPNTNPVTTTIGGLVGGMQATPSGSTTSSKNDNEGIVSLLPDLQLPTLTLPTEDDFNRALQALLAGSISSEPSDESSAAQVGQNMEWVWLTRVDPTLFNAEFYKHQPTPIALTFGLGGGGLGMILAGLGMLKGHGWGLFGQLLQGQLESEKQDTQLLMQPSYRE